MKLISRVKIERFRSLKFSNLKVFGDFTVFAGLNNSGKSNVLRALNAFFNDLTDQDRPVDVDNDYFRGGAKVKRKRQIRVTVYFELPEQFKFRTDLQEVENLLGGRSFSITKEWVRDETEPRIYLNEETTSLELAIRQKILQFLSLISFRYIPNRVMPTDIIKREHQALRDVLIRQLGRKGGGKEAFERIAKSSTRLISDVAIDFRSIVPEVQELRLDTPTSWEQMVFAFGYRLKESGVEFDDTVQGSGIQSLLMFETLHLIDRDYRQRFGWRQASIWAVEEPESSLHSSLEGYTALLLSRMAHDPKNRLQVLGTTHSDLMIQYADQGYLVRKSPEGSKLELKSSADLVEQSAKEGISRWVHPILYHPLKPLCLVDGKIDYIFITEAYKTLNINFDGELSYLEKLRLATDGATGGVNDLLEYIKKNIDVIKMRKRNAPIIVLLDWEDSGKVSSYQKLFTEKDPFIVMAWPESQSNPNLSSRIRGIEKFYPDRIIGIAESQNLVFRNKKGKATIDPIEIGQAKAVMAKHIENDGLRKEDLLYAEKFLREIAARVVEEARIKP